MNFFDLCNLDDEHIADIIIFEDGSCVLKFDIFLKIHCFDDFEKLQKALKAFRLGNYKMVQNGVISV